MLNRPRLEPTAACQLIHERQLEFVQTSAAVRSRVDYLVNACHLTRYIVSGNSSHHLNGLSPLLASSWAIAIATFFDSRALALKIDFWFPRGRSV